MCIIIPISSTVRSIPQIKNNESVFFHPRIITKLFQIAEMERHNREIESQLKSGANGAGVSNGNVVGNGIISDAASRIPIVGPFIVPILKRLGLGLADINTITKGGSVECNGICVKKVGGGLFIETGKGLNLGTQNSGAGVGIVSGNGLF